MIVHEDHNDGSESAYYPRIVLCVPGTWSDAAELAERLRAGPFRWTDSKLRAAEGPESFDAEFRGPDLRMKAAFQASACRVRPSLTSADYAAVQGHRSVAYVLSDNFGRSTAAGAASRMIDAGLALIEAGGIAVKCESSGIAHSAARWRELAARLRLGGGSGATRSDALEERARAWAPLFDAYVRLPIIDDNKDLYSCGMHLLGASDAHVALADFPGDDIASAHRVLEGFLREFRNDLVPGRQELQRSFKPEGKDDRFLSVPEPCSRYPEDAFFWNRWGCFRLRRA